MKIKKHITALATAAALSATLPAVAQQSQHMAPETMLSLARVGASALSPDGVFVTNWWSGDQRYQRFVERLLNVFDGRVLELPAESHGNVAVMAFQSSPKEQNLDKLKKRAEKLSGQYGLDFKRMLSDLKANNPNNGKHFYL